jgi:large subunit ribosomal protein L20
MRCAAPEEANEQFQNFRQDKASEEVPKRRLQGYRLLPPAATPKRKKGANTMPRVKRGTKRSDRRKKILKRASGYFLTKSKLYQAAQEAVERGLKFAYTGRRQKKRQFRSLWIVRISAAAKLNNFSYSQLINGLKKAGIELDRKILADIAVQDAPGFTRLVEQAKAALETEKSAK